MRVTVITVSYNSEKTIAKTIESVLHQTYQNIEYIIVDGASTDNTVNIAESYLSRFEETEGRTLKIVSEPDRGMYDALNKGARMATGELVGQINSDDWYEPDAIEKMVALYEREAYDAAWGNLNMIRPDGSVMHKKAKIGRLWTTTGWCHPAMFSKRTVLLEFPYALESMYDDFDYITAVYKAGKKLVTIDETISNFTFGGMSTKRSMKEAMHRVKITYAIYRKHGMSRLYWLHRFAFEIAKYLIS